MAGAATETEIVRAEHDSSANVQLKRGGFYGWDSSALQWVKLAVDANGNVVMLQAGASTVGTGRKTSTTIGTAVAIGASTTIKRIIIQAIVDNTDVVYIGDSNTLATDGSERGIGLYASNSVSFAAINLSNIYLDVRVSGEGVSFWYEN